MLAVTDIRLPVQYCTSLQSLGYELVKLPPFAALPAPVASHPDMLIFIIGQTLLTHRDYYNTAKREIDKITLAGQLHLILSDEYIGNKYPSDILLNAAPVGNFVFAHAANISCHISKTSALYGMNIINIKQGYARCSLVIIDDNAIITSDRGIDAAARKHGLDSLCVRAGHVRLPGYNTGFIGGASGRCGDKVFFCGELSGHPDATAINEFCVSHLCEVVSLGSGELFDAGTIFFI